jgi:hypothetical protein
MKPKFKKQSAIELAGDSFVIAIGRAMVAFAGIEGALNFCLPSLVNNWTVWKHLADTGVSKRLDIYGDLLVERGMPLERVRKVIATAKALFRKRNLIAHNSLVTTGEPPFKFIMRLHPSKAEETLTIEEITSIGDKADELYDQLWQLYWEEKKLRFPNPSRIDHA